MKNRRRFYRWQFAIPCRYWWGDHSAEGTVSNISYGGLCIRGGSQTPPQGTIINVCLTLGDAYKCRLQASVVYTQPSPVNQAVFGVEFQETLSERSSKLRHILDQCVADDTLVEA